MLTFEKLDEENFPNNPRYLMFICIRAIGVLTRLCVSWPVENTCDLGCNLLGCSGPSSLGLQIVHLSLCAIHLLASLVTLACFIQAIASRIQCLELLHALPLDYLVQSRSHLSKWNIHTRMLLLLPSLRPPPLLFYQQMWNDLTDLTTRNPAKMFQST